MDIYVQKDGQKQGPFSEARIRQGIDAGEFGLTDLSWAKGKASWQPLSALINLDTDEPPPLTNPLSVEHQLPPPLTIHSPVTSVSAGQMTGHLPTPNGCSANAKQTSLSTAGSRLFRSDIFSSAFVRNTVFAIGIILPAIGGGAVAFLLSFIPLTDSGAVAFIKELGLITMPLWISVIVALKLIRASLLAKHQYLGTQPSGIGRHFVILIAIGLFTLGVLSIILGVTSDHSLSAEELNLKNHSEYRSPEDKARLAGFAGLRRDKDEYLLSYGKPVKTTHGAELPAADDLYFVKGELVYEVSFWNGQAHHVNVYREDLEALTGDEIKRGLDAFAGGKRWKHKATSDKDRWEHEDVAAWIVDERKHYPNSKSRLPVTILRISTNEFWDAHVKSEQANTQ